MRSCLLIIKPQRFFLESILHQFSRRPISTPVIMSVSLASILLASRFMEPDWIPGMCIFKWITGLPCMFCGLTHSFHAISLGNFQQALAYHPLGFLAYVLVLFHLVIAVLRLAGWRHPRLLPRFKIMTMMNLTFVSFTLVWLFRLATGSL